MKIFFKILISLIIVAIVIISILFFYNKSRRKPVIYETTTPFVTNIIKKTVATGSVVPRKEIEIKPQVSGIVQNIYVEAGENVKKGDIIAKVKIIPNMVNLNNAESRVNKAKINLKDKEKAFNRQKQLYEKKVIAISVYQQYELALNTAKEEVDAAENNLQLIKEGISRKSEKTTNTLIRSTIDGMILDVPVEEGNSVIESNAFNAGTTIATVADMAEMIFDGKVDESEVGKIKEGMELILTIGAIESDKFTAILEYIAPKGFEENGAIQFEIKADVELKESHFIRAGYSANAAIVLAKRDSVLAISESLLQFDKEVPFVEVEVGKQEFEKRNIELGLSDGLNIEIISGLDTNDKIKVLSGGPPQPAIR